MRFSNPKKNTPQQQAISNLSEESKFIASGSAKGYALDSYSWIADYSFKSPNNTFLNPHIAHVSFFSDREIMNQEFGNVSELYDTYNFLSAIQRQKYSPHSFELNRKQYATISSRGSEFDFIQYLNLSDKQRISILGIPHPKFSYNHEYWRSPAFTSSGYLVHLDNASPTVKLGQAQYYDRYYWAHPWQISSTIDLNSANIDMGTNGSDFVYPNEAINQIDIIFDNAEVTNDLDIKRILDVKLNIDNTKYSYFKSSPEWVNYYNETSHYYNKSYNPYYGAVNFYDDYWNEINPMAVGSQTYYINNFVTFFPEIIRNSILEPAKVVARWPLFSNWSQNYQTNYSGKMIFNNGISMSEPNDQSRIVYNLCRHMLNKPATNGEPFNSTDYVNFKMDPDGNYLYCGIDIDTERNRRHSSIVMVEPYMTTIPICNGEIVNYLFIGSDGEPTGSFIDDADFASRPGLFLKIKATKNIIAEIDSILKIPDYNTDIIETITINNVLNKLGYIGNAGDPYYTKLGNGDAQEFFKRQDDCLDDLIGADSSHLGMVGQGKHAVFYFTDSTDRFGTLSNYTAISGNSNYRRKVSGLGFGSTIDSNGTVDHYLNVYCSNYYPINAPAPGSYAPIENINKFFCDATQGENSYQYERLYPMIKVSGINGYIKITGRNNSFKMSRASDGGYEVIYNIEFPYCPGSYSERLNGFSTEYAETWILQKSSYIPAGSWAADPNGRYSIDNDRHTPFADDSFCYHSILNQQSSSGTISTNTFVNGGGIYQLSPSSTNVISYPAALIWQTNEFNLLSLTKPKVLGFRHYGTYDVRLSENSSQSSYSKDIKLFGLIDNRKWKFDDNKFLSYINRENPSYICNIDVSALFNDMTKYQRDNASIPDMKRWIFSMFSGFSNTVQNVDTSISDESSPITECINTFKNIDLSSQESGSDIVIEAWDQLSLLGSTDVTRAGNWRPMSPLNSDTNKTAGLPLTNNVYIKSGSITLENSDFPGKNIYSIILGYLDSNADINFPTYALPYFGQPNDVINGRSNLVLYNAKYNLTYHISYITTQVINSIPYYKAYIYYDPSLSILNTTDISNIELGTSGQYSICLPEKQMNKNISFKLYTSQVAQGVAENLLTRYIDIRTTSDVLSNPDLNRFIDSNNRLYFRIRVVKNKDYPISYKNNDESTIQYLWDSHKAPIANQWINFPWKDPNTGDIDGQFTWDKISVKEVIRKLGMTYFKSGSK